MPIDAGATRELLSGVMCSMMTSFIHLAKVVNTFSRLLRFLTPLKVIVEPEVPTILECTQIIAPHSLPQGKRLFIFCK